jgi:phosphatidate cytidylyltransferase
MKLNNLLARTLTGAIFVSAIVSSMIISPLVFAGLFLGVALLAVHEFYRLLNAVKGIKVQLVAASLAAAVLYVSLAAVALDLVSARLLFINILWIPLLFIVELYQRNEKPLSNVSFTLMSLGYVVAPLALLNFFFVPLSAEGGHYYGFLLGFFVTLWSYDSFAYLTGVLIGRHRLFARISPKKSWEGAIGGFVFGLLAAWILSTFFPEFDLYTWMIAAVVIMIFGTFGDLSESMIKRSLNIKDSGSILPGHGGLLDRFDAALLAAPAVFVFIQLKYFF